jgi:hypothetical protein
VTVKRLDDIPYELMKGGRNPMAEVRRVKQWKIAGVWLRWVARLTGALAALFFLSFFVGEGLLGPQNFFKSGFEGISVKIFTGIAMLLIGSLGLLLAWRWERAGAWVALWAVAGFTAVYPRGFPIWVLAAMALPAVLFLLAYKLTRSRPPTAHAPV